MTGSHPVSSGSTGGEEGFNLGGLVCLGNVVELPVLREFFQEFFFGRLRHHAPFIDIVLEFGFPVIAAIGGERSDKRKALGGSYPRPVAGQGGQLILEDGTIPDPIEDGVIPDDRGRGGKAKVGAAQVARVIAGTLIGGEGLLGRLGVVEGSQFGGITV